MNLITFQELLKQKTMYRLGKDVDCSVQWMWGQVNRVGFSMNTLKRIKTLHPEVDLNDMVMNYPIKKKPEQEIDET